MKITIVGLGYVGSAYAALFSRKHDVIAIDKDQSRVDALNEKRSPVGNSLMEEILNKERSGSLTATTDRKRGYSDADYILIATDTRLNETGDVLDTSSIYNVMDAICKAQFKSKAPTVILKSTVPTGFTAKLQEEYPNFIFIFSPEFLREKTVMEDVLNPTRIVVGCDGEKEAAEIFAEAQIECSDKKDIPLLYTSTAEAEAIKLFSNSYLALRVAFFNELDTFAQVKGLSTDKIIKGVCLDPRIGDYYNVPGPGFGGNCLPKDTRQLVADFKAADTPEQLINAAIEENEIRKEFVSEK